MKKTLCLALIMALLLSSCIPALSEMDAAVDLPAGNAIISETDFPQDASEEADLSFQASAIGYDAQTESMLELGSDGDASSGIDDPCAADAEAGAADSAEEQPALYWRVAEDRLDVLSADGADGVPALATLRAGDVVMLVANDDNNAFVAFHTERGIVEGRVAISALLPLDEAQTSAFLDQLTLEEVFLYGSDLDLPLPNLAPEFPNAPAQDVSVADDPADDEEARTEADTTDAAPAEADDTAAEQIAPECTDDAEPADEEAEGFPEDVSTEETGIEADQDDGDVPAANASAFPSTLDIGLKEVSTVLEEVASAGGMTGLKWASSNETIVRVNEYGVITGLKKGTASIAVQSADGEKSAVCEVSVKAAPSKVKISPSSAKLGAQGMTWQLTPTVNKGAASSRFTYTSSNAAVATVDANGLICAIAPGTAKITAKSFNGKRATVKVSVVAAPSSVVLAASEMKLAVDQQSSLPARALDANGKVTLAQLTFTVDSSSPNPSCIAVDPATGAILARSKGTAYITVKAHNGVAAATTCKVTVVAAAAALNPAEPEIQLGVKESSKPLALKMVPPQGESSCSAGITWYSANPKIAKVNAQTGVVTGVRTGTTAVYAVSHNGVTSSGCSVTILKAPSKITLTPSKVTLSDDEDQTSLRAELNKGSSSAITYTSSNPSVVTVDENGVLTAHAAGKATVTAQTFNKKKAVCKVTVIPAPAQVFLPEKLLVAEQQSTTVRAEALDANGKATLANYTYAAVDGTGSIAIDPKTGTLYGVRAGTAYVRVAAHNGVTTHIENGKAVETVCRVVVCEAPDKIELNLHSLTLGVKQEQQLQVRMLRQDGSVLTESPVRFTSSNAKVATVSEDGTIRAIKAGSVTIKVIAANGQNDICKLTVKKAPTKVVISPANPVIGIDQSGTLSVSFKSKSEYGAVLFASSDPAVATVDAQTGFVQAKSEGTTVITAIAYNGVRGQTTLRVSRAPEYIRLNTDYALVYDSDLGGYRTYYHLSMKKGETYRLAGAVEFGTRGSITGYSIDNTKVATIDENGQITALSQGTADITVTATGGVSTKCRLTVAAASEARAAFAAQSVEVRVGKTALLPTLKTENISQDMLAQASWSVSDAQIAALVLNDNGDWCVTGKAEGTALVSVRVGDATAQAAVEVLPAQDDGEIHFTVSGLRAAVGESGQLHVVDGSGSAVDAQFVSGNPDIVQVSEAGMMTAIAAGSATIGAVYGSKTATLSVKVFQPAESVSLSADSVRLPTGGRYMLEPTIPDNAASAVYEYSSSNSAVAYVTRSGMILARKKGRAVITVTAYGGAHAQCAVEVYPSPTRVVLQPNAVEGKVSEQDVQLSWRFGAEDEEGTVTFASSNKNVCLVDANGRVSFLSAGTAVITARTNNGYTDTVPVTVLPDEAVESNVHYRIFTACSYAKPGFSGKGSLPFPQNNAKSVANVFGNSSINGNAYTVNPALINPSKAKLRSSLSSFFGATGDNDVSIVYLCSHGTMNRTNYNSYIMVLAGYESSGGSANYYLTSQEIFNAVSSIRGRVVLILDSCYSGAFLEDMLPQLKAAGGRISVMTAASDTRASFYNVSSTSRAVDFFTFFLLQGLGYNERDGWYYQEDGSKGSAYGYLAADTGVRDGVVTLREFYTYASRCIAANIPTYMKARWYWGSKDAIQTPRFYAGGNGSLILYKPR